MVLKNQIYQWKTWGFVLDRPGREVVVIVGQMWCTFSEELNYMPLAENLQTFQYLELQMRQTTTINCIHHRAQCPTPSRDIRRSGDTTVGTFRCQHSSTSKKASHCWSAYCLRQRTKAMKFLRRPSKALAHCAHHNSFVVCVILVHLYSKNLVRMGL